MSNFSEEIEKDENVPPFFARDKINQTSQHFQIRWRGYIASETMSREPIKLLENALSYG